MWVQEPINSPFANAHQIGERNCRVIEHHPEGRSMEISAAQYISAFAEYERIVCCRTRFDLNHGASVLKCISHGSVHLWHTAQAVGVLNARIIREMRKPDFAISEQIA